MSKKNDIKKIAETIRMLMQEFGMFSDAQLARKVGMVYSSLCRKMAGETKFNRDEMIRISEVLDICPGILFFPGHCKNCNKTKNILKK